VLSDPGKFLGMEDIDVGDLEFDEAFAIKSNDDEKVGDLFANPKLRQVIHDEPTLRLEVRDNEDWFGSKFS
jgi:hypothetical protein